MKKVYPENILQKLKNLPQKPGVYIFYNSQDKILYIGKAKNLKNRVRQYFSGSDERPQIPFLLAETANLDYTITSSELEALYLERTLIQKNTPPYNIELKDDKNYAFICLDYSFEIPQMLIHRKIWTNENDAQKKKRFYFGPFTSTKKIRDIFFTLRKIFGVCSETKVGKPCFYSHLHRCPGVCSGKISIDEYKKNLDSVKLFLSGKITEATKKLKKEMLAASKTQNFEKAAKLRDELSSLTMLSNKQNVISAKNDNLDIISLFSENSLSSINLFKVRQGKLIDKLSFIYSSENRPVDLPDTLSAQSEKKETLEKFLENYYLDTSDIPKKIILCGEISNQELLKKILQEKSVKKVLFQIPKKGDLHKLIELGQTNAAEHLKNFQNQKASEKDRAEKSLNELKSHLKLTNIPRRIECYDISNIQGTNPVGSMVVFENGLPKKSEYRKFKITVKSTPDDFAMMQEMISRRAAKTPTDLTQTTSDFWPLPDLLVIDGGKGQLSSVVEILKNTSLKTIPIIGLAKRIEEIFFPENPTPLTLPHTNEGLKLLQRIRDEAHRFGVTFHRSLRSKNATKSQLDDIAGIGPKTKKLLKAKFGTTADIKNANLNDLEKIIGKSKAQLLKKNII